MSHPKSALQDAEETFHFGVELVEVDGLCHESVGSGLKNPFLAFNIPADGNNGGLVFRVSLDAPADLDSVDSGDHDIEHQEIGFQAADFDESGDTVRCR